MRTRIEKETRSSLKLQSDRGAGVVYLVGAGPGSPDLITLRGQAIVRRADTVVYDYLIDPALLVDVRPDAKIVSCASFGKGRQRTDPQAQARINACLVAEARAGKVVVHLKSGDPGVFGRVEEEIAALEKAGVPWDIVPGVTAATAAAASAGISLTGRGIAPEVTFVTGREAELSAPRIDWDRVARSATAVIYMGVERIDVIARALLRVRPAGTPVAIVRRAGWVDEKVWYSSLGELVKTVKLHRITPPAIFVVGETARRLSQGSARAGRAFLTGTSSAFYDRRYRAVHVPLVRVEPLSGYRRQDGLLRKIRQFDWLVLTSRNAVDFFFQRLLAVGEDARSLRHLKVAAIGEVTAGQLRKYGIIADIVARNQTSSGLLQALSTEKMSGCKVLVPASSISRGIVAAGLRERGALVTQSSFYRNVPAKSAPEVDLAGFEEIVFSSPSGVKSFASHYGRPPHQCRLLCVGPVTYSEARKVFGKGYRYAKPAH